MKLTKILSKVFFVTSFVLLPSFCFAQLSISEAISRTPIESVPFYATKKTSSSDVYGYGIVNPNNVIPDKLYDNLQLTQYTYAHDDTYQRGVFFRKFAIPNSNNVLLIVSFGGATEWRTDMACVISPSGQVLNSLEVAIRVSDVWVKQFRISDDNEIIVTAISPFNETSSIPFTTFDSFMGVRTDEYYAINAQGQFVLSHKTSYMAIVYYRSYLTGTTNLWEGAERATRNGKFFDVWAK